MDVTVHNLNLHYGTYRALHDVSCDLHERSVTALIGPSGCGKSSFLRSVNRMNDLIDGARVDGQVLLNGDDIYAPECDVVDLRRRVGMVFQRPAPFPMSIFNNVAYGLRAHGLHDQQQLAEAVETSLRQAYLWDEVKDRIGTSAMGLSGGQQQRLVIARVLAVKPEVILMDEPASALDPVSTGHLEDLIGQLKKDYTIIIVTHNMQQAARVSDYTGFFLNGQLVEFAGTDSIFTNPHDKRTEDYITGRFG